MLSLPLSASLPATAHPTDPAPHHDGVINMFQLPALYLLLLVCKLSCPA